VGFPIRKSGGQRLLTPHPGLSQRATSFIACMRQGIHELPLPHACLQHLRAHTTNISAEAEPFDGTLHACRRSVQPTRHSAERHSVRDDNLSLVKTRMHGPARRHSPEAARYAQDRHLAASILRTHSQCQRGPHKATQNLTFAHEEPMSSSNWINCSGAGGAYRDRTDDLMLAKQPLSQLS
jgi:hypothetical protein